MRATKSPVGESQSGTDRKRKQTIVEQAQRLLQRQRTFRMPTDCQRSALKTYLPTTRCRWKKPIDSVIGRVATRPGHQWPGLPSGVFPLLKRSAMKMRSGFLYFHRCWEIWGWQPQLSGTAGSHQCRQRWRACLFRCCAETKADTQQVQGYFGFSSKALNANQAPMVQLLHDVISAPRFETAHSGVDRAISFTR